MKRNLLSIGKMAEMNQVTVPTLRLYDQLGLLKPRHVDGQTGYRYYDINQNARLDMIAYMKELGMSLKEIQGVLEAEDIALIEQILARKTADSRADARPAASAQRGGASHRQHRALPQIARHGHHRAGIHRPEVRLGHSMSRSFYERTSPPEQALMDLRRALLKKNCPQILFPKYHHLHHPRKLRPRTLCADRVFHLHPTSRPRPAA